MRLVNLNQSSDDVEAMLDAVLLSFQLLLREMKVALCLLLPADSILDYLLIDKVLISFYVLRTYIQ